MNVLTHFLFWMVMNGTNTINVTTYGATGNGVTDDTHAIDSALTIAHNSQKNVYFPTGTYLCNTIDGSNHILTFNAGGLNNITIFGDGNSSVITTSDTGTVGCTLFYIFAFSKSYGLVIGNLYLKNTHTKTLKQTTGLYLQGTSGQDLDTVTVRGMSFAGFCNDVLGQGITGWYLKYDSFYSPHGHDDAIQNGTPAVQISMADNANGSCINVDIENCYGEGYSGPIPLNCPRPMDGMVYGIGYGVAVVNNVMKFYSQEYILIKPPVTAPSTSAQVLVSGNSIDQTLPPGAVDDNGALHKYNYGIRVDASHTRITNNTLINYTWGIMVRTVDYTSLSGIDINISGNKLRTPKDTITNKVQTGIYLSGSPSFPITSVGINNNLVSLIDTIPYQLFNVTAPVMNGNLWSPLNLF